MKAKRSNYAGMIALLLIGAAGVYAIGVYIKRTPEAQDVPAAIHRANHRDAKGSTPTDQADPSRKSSVTILTPKSDKGNLSFDESTDQVPEGQDPIVYVVNRYLQNSHILPSTARALSVQVQEGIAKVDCTEAMDKTVGSADEATLLQGFSKALSQFENVKKVQFFVSGRAIDSFGNVDISQGIDVKDPDGSSTQPGA